MSLANQPNTTNVVQFRRPANDAMPVEIEKPSQAMVTGVLIAALVSVMSDKVQAKYRRRLRRAYETAQDPAYKETCKLAAEAIGCLA